MTAYSPSELGKKLGSGLLSFPVTHFRQEDLAFDEAPYREHVARLGQYPIAGIFAAGGTGEFFSLTPSEVGAVVKAAVQSAPSGMPVVAPVGYGTRIAVELARAAEKAGADGILLFPPYLTEADAEGLADHVEAVCRATSLGVILYSRGNAVYSADTVARLASSCPNLAGYKDGVGNLDLMTRVVAKLGDRLVYIGGLPTAETFALPYLELGVSTYSSAIFNFLPEFALEFYDAVRAKNRTLVFQWLDQFVLPYTEIRNRRQGYAVSIVKAGMKVVGRPAGPVRSPLVDLDEAEVDALSVLVSRLPRLHGADRA
ncbi:5-dehydro-4-deoxyglucarate dehydratase [Pendulispora brunnea]|uniref:Probable 5-dehydro-4-deoxyglucarate dehydratase n=1 Tax=Pendulispora brunnea TaxID=2905690 RepID=A0ABZ2JW35_9BACT